MGRPRKPTAVLELTGAFEHDPSRRRPHEPKPTGPLGKPPDYFDAEQRELWAELEAMAPVNVLQCTERWLIEMAVKTMHRIRKDTAKSADYGRMLAFLSKMGLTPVDRSKVLVPTTEENDGLDAFAAECRGEQ